MRTVEAIKAMKLSGEKIAMTTAYDAAFSAMAEEAQMDLILVGDSLANVLLGYKSTREIGMTEMEIFTAAVARGAPNTHIVSDMPYGSDETPELALKNARRLIRCGASAVKIEGPKLDCIRTLKENGIEVMGHLGLLPQTAKNFRQCGRDEESAKKILKEALSLDALGIYACVLEHIPASLGKEISEKVQMVTIGIGAGKETDGQVLVMHDFLRMHTGKVPPFVEQTANLHDAVVEGFLRYRAKVKTST